MNELHKPLNETQVIETRQFARMHCDGLQANEVLGKLHNSTYHPVYRAELARVLVKRLSLEENSYMDLTV